MRYRRNNGYILRSVMNKNMLFPIGTSTQEMQGTIIFNEIAAFVWNQMDEFVTKEHLVGTIVNEYDVSYESAETDVDALLNTLLSYSLISCDEEVG